MDKTLEEHVLNLKKIFREAIQEALNSSGYGPYSHPEYSSVVGKIDDRLSQIVSLLETISAQLEPKSTIILTGGTTDASKSD